MWNVFIWLSTGKSLYYISFQPFSAICKHHYKIISQGNIRHVRNVMSNSRQTGLRRVYVGIGSLVCIVNLLFAQMFWWGWAVKAKELRILVGSDFFQTWKLSSWKPYLCLVTHSYSDKLVLGRIQSFITNIWCIGCAQIFNLMLPWLY